MEVPRVRKILVASALALACAVAVPLAAQKSAQKKQTPERAPDRQRVASRDVPTLRAIRPARRMPGAQDQEEFSSRAFADRQRAADSAPREPREPRERRLRRASSFDGDLRSLPQTRPRRFERPEREGPDPSPVMVERPGAEGAPVGAAPVSGAEVAAAPAPPPSATFPGLDFANFGAGHPPDTNGDVGPLDYIQSINTSLGIFDKATGARLAAFPFDTFMSQGHFGNVCDTENFGDPVVLYDTFEDRWVVTDFAFVLTSGGAVVPPALQCFAVSKTGDPLTGGWNFYSTETIGGLGDYPKLGVWPDGIYMSVNVFGYAAGSTFQTSRVFALNKAQMYAGSPTVQVVTFDAPGGDFTLLPSNARLQTGTPPAGSPNYFVSTSLFLNALAVYKFHVDWDRISLSTFTGPDVPISATSWPNAAVPNALSLGGNALDALGIRAMMQNQYSNIGGAESLWAAHTVRRADINGFAAPRWYQVNVTGGVVAPNIPQAATFDPDGANVMSRFMPSVAVDRQGNLAMGYSTSSASTKPAIKYAGRLAGDPINTLSQTEQVLFQGTGTQTGNCGAGACARWGDYSAMSLDPDGCTFWYTNMYYAVDGLNHQTRIGSFTLPGCFPSITTGFVQGTVKTALGVPLSGAFVALGSRTATTDVNGFYLFTGLPAGAYPTIAAAFAGYAAQSFGPIAVTEGGTAVQDFVLAAGAPAACLVDTSLTDFQRGVASNCDLSGTPGSVTLLEAPPALNQQNLNVTTSGFGVNSTSWAGQTFTPSATGPLARVDLDLFCSGCTGTTPNLTVSIRATTAAATPLPTGPDLAVATIPGFSSASGGYFAAQFATPITLTAGTRYAIIVRPVSNPSAGTYAYVVSAANPYANGLRVTSGNSGGTWTADATSGGRDLGFKVYLKAGLAPSGTFVSSAKDANPATGATPTWLSIAWTATVPAGTTLSFQAAASNNVDGPFTFVGPDGTAASTFTSGASLAQFNGLRYLKYRATFTTTSSTTTARLDDVTICYEDVRAVTALAVDAATGPYNGAATLSATLTTGGSGVGGKTVAFALNGVPVGTATTSASGVATLANVSLAGITGGIYASGVTASFAGDLGYMAADGANTLTVTRLPQTITFGALAGKVSTDPPFTISATADSGLAVAFSTTPGACSVSGNEVTLLAAGMCAIDANQPGDDNYEAAPTVTQTFNVDFASQAIVFGALANKIAIDPPFSIAATGGDSGNPVVFSTTSTACSVSGNTVTLLTAGTCTIEANQAGDARYSAAPPVTQSFSIALATQTIAFGALAARAYGAPDFTVTATASSGLPVSFAASGQCSVTGALVHITGAGSCSITASQAGDARYSAALSVTQTFAIGTAALTVTADNKTKVLHSSNPVLTGTLTGVVPGDNITATFSTAAVTLSPIGSYPIVPALVDPGNRLPNYTVTKVPGALTVIFAPPGPCFGGPGHQILPPIKPDGSSVFKPNTKVDVAFRVCEAYGIPVFWMDVVRSFTLVKIVKNGSTRNVSIDLEGDSDDHDKHGRHQREFRFDLDDLAWVFHLNTKVLDGEGTYYFRIVLHDGTAIDFSFSLKKK